MGEGARAPSGGAPSLWDFSEGDLVWAHQRACPWWPAEIMPADQAPPAVRRLGRPDQVCVMYLGHKGAASVQRRFYGWVGRGAVLPYAEHVERFSGQKLKKSDCPAQFAEALEEARLWQPQGAFSSESLSNADTEGGGGCVRAGAAAGVQGGIDKVAGLPGEASSGQRCSKCGETLADRVGFEFQGRLGMCRPCHRSFQSGCYCPVCDRAYSPTAKDMVCCDSCGHWIHSQCDLEAQEVLQEDLKGRQRSYSCPGCRTKAMAAEGGGADRLREGGEACLPGSRAVNGGTDQGAGRSPSPVHILDTGPDHGPGPGPNICAADSVPVPHVPDQPPGMAELLPGGEVELDLLDFDIPADLEKVPAPLLRHGSGHDFGEAPRPSAEASPGSRQRLRQERRERRRQEREERRERKKQVKRYAKSCFANDFLPGYMLSHKKASRMELQEIVRLHWKALDQTLHRYYYKMAQDAVDTKSVPEWAAATARSSKGARAAGKLLKERKGLEKQTGKKKKNEKGASNPGRKRKQLDGLGGLCGPNKKKSTQAKVFVQGGTSLAAAIRDAKPTLPAEVSVICTQSYRGNFYVHDLKVLCMSDCCVGRPEEERTFTPVRWEAHCGAGSAKKWKSTIRLEPGTVPELPTGSVPKPIGRWLEQRGVIQGKPTIAIREATPEPEEDLPPWMGARSRSFEPVRAVWALDRCAVCDMDVDYDYDQFVSCDACGITVHQSCYGVKEAPDIDDMWLCRACELREAGDPAPQCCLCPVEGGALKPTSIPDTWCHVTCMQWTPEVTVADVDRMEPIANIKNIQTERWELVCSICQQRMGAGIQCTECFTAYHPLCARIEGYFMEIREPATKRPGAPLQYISYCDKHRKPHLGETGLSRPGAAGESTQRKKKAIPDLSAYILHARLPHFEPENEQGCTRCVPLDTGWVRDTKGAGSGISSLKGFWIPEGPLPAMRPATPALQSPPKGRTQRLGGMEEAPPAAQDALPGEAGVDMEKCTERMAPTFEGLLPLPEGCSEALKIACNGKRAIFNIRSQQVTYKGDEMTATRFEQLCGRHSKKWKTSLCVDRPEKDCTAEPETVGMWLSAYGLDRRLLSRLADNHAKRKAFVLWEHDTIELGTRAALDDALLRTFGIPMSLQQEGVSRIDGGRAGRPVCASVVHISVSPSDSTPPPPSSQQTVELRSKEVPDISTLVRPGSNRCGYCATCQNRKAKKGCLTMKRKKAQKDERPHLATKINEEGPRPLCGPQALLPGLRLLHVGEFGHECVGRRLSVFWGVDDTWYRGRVTAYDEYSGKHRVMYDDGEEEDLFLAAETWEYEKGQTAPPAKDGEGQPKWSVKKNGVSKMEWGTSGRSDMMGGEAEHPLPSTEVLAAFATCPQERMWSGEPSGLNCVGWRVGIWWVDDKCFYRAVVTGYEPDIGLHSVWYDDDVKEDLLLEAESVQWLAPPGAFRLPRSEQGEQGKSVAEVAEADEQPKANGPLAALPEELPVVCNGMTATFLPASQMVCLDDHTSVPPGQFEKIAGRNQAKKWKASIRVRKKDGTPGRTMGDWLVEQGLDAPRAPKTKEGGAGSSAPTKGGGFRSTHRQKQAGGGGVGGPFNGHRPGCLCVVCKNKRRLGLLGPLGGSTGGGGFPVAPQIPQDLGCPPCGQASGPSVRTGKRAFIEGTYQNPGLTRHHVSQLPLSRMWIGADWLAEQNKKLKQREDESAAIRARDEEVQALAAALKAEAVAQEVLKREAAAVAGAERKLAALAALEATADLVRQGSMAVSKREPAPVRQQPVVVPVCAEAVGWRVGIWWEDDGCFYYGQLKDFLSGPGTEKPESSLGTAEQALYALKYDDGLTEEVDLSKERVDWVAQADSDAGVLHRIGSANGDSVQAPPADLHGQPRRCRASAAPQGVDAEGWRIAVRWDEDRTYYFAVVEAYDLGEAPRAYRVLYDDGETEWLDLGQERLKWVAPHGYYKRPSGQVPAAVKVVCGTLEGLFLVHNRRVEVAGETVTPMAFEKLGGRENAKKWKTSLRVVGSDGHPGKNVGDWLISMGVEMPRGKLAKAASSAPEKPADAQQLAANTGEEEATAVVNGQADAIGATGTAEAMEVTDGQPTVTRDDKGGGTNSTAAEQPAGPGAVPAERPLSEEPRETDPGREAPPYSLAADPVKMEKGSAPSIAAVEPPKLEKRAVSMAEKLRACERTEGERILFGKSGIHGWGLFARRDIEQGEFLIEYRGDRIRPHVANEREARYKLEGKDMYLFSLSDEWIVDATDCGSAARFMNHSCAPSTMSKIVDVDEFPHLVFVARCTVQAGQELTYDYRLAKEDDGEKLPCLCGAPTCRGTLN